jgi:toxin ParE1/3/4
MRHPHGTPRGESLIGAWGAHGTWPSGKPPAAACAGLHSESGMASGGHVVYCVDDERSDRRRARTRPLLAARGSGGTRRGRARDRGATDGCLRLERRGARGDRRGPRRRICFGPRGGRILEAPRRDMNVRYRVRALADIDDIRAYLQKRSPTGAFNVVQAIYASIRSIADQPYGFQRTDDPHLRMKVVRPYRYKFFYSIVDETTVEIVHVRQTSRRPWRRIES